MGHPLGYWTFPETERRRRAWAYLAGIATGLALAAAAFLAGAQCPPFC